MATRKASGKALTALAEAIPDLLGGSADLAGSNNTDIDSTVFSRDDRLGRIVRFGVREHAMAAVCNGIGLHGGFIPYGAMFLIFTDYARPAIRLSALMGVRVVWMMTHDSIGLGEDGPTHQPIEHLASLRAMPGLQVIRPADAAETAQAWAVALETSGPTVLSLTRQDVPDLGDKPEDAVDRGGYVVRDADGGIDIVLIGTGSEVQIAVTAADLLAADGVAARVVSLPSWERFQAQSQDYRDEVLPPTVSARVSVEAAATFGWERWVGDRGASVGLDRFGASALGTTLYDEFGFTAERVADVARGVLS